MQGWTFGTFLFLQRFQVPPSRGSNPKSLDCYLTFCPFAVLLTFCLRHPLLTFNADNLSVDILTPLLCHPRPIRTLRNNSWPLTSLKVSAGKTEQHRVTAIIKAVE